MTFIPRTYLSRLSLCFKIDRHSPAPCVHDSIILGSENQHLLNTCTKSTSIYKYRNTDEPVSIWCVGNH